MADHLDFDARFDLAMEAARMRFQERGNFLSDSDLYDFAEDFTTSDLSWRDDDDIEVDDPRIDDADYVRMLNALDAACFIQPADPHNPYD